MSTKYIKTTTQSYITTQLLILHKIKSGGMGENVTTGNLGGNVKNLSETNMVISSLIFAFPSIATGFKLRE